MTRIRDRLRPHVEPDVDEITVDELWTHDHHGLWVLYRHLDPDTGAVLGRYEFRENRTQSHKQSNRVREFDDPGRYRERQSLLQRNRSAYNAAMGVGDSLRGDAGPYL